MPPNEQGENALFAKLAGFQAIIPQFDNSSAVTAKFFVDSLEHVTGIANCSEDEKLLIMKSRIRGDALSHIINSPDLSQETKYTDFKNKFLAYFQNKASLASRQQQFANCRMMEGEQAKVYASRVTDVTQKFFGNLNLTNADVKTLFEQSKLSKFLEGLLPKYRQQTLMKDPQTFQEALNFVELLQSNSFELNSPENNASTNNLQASLSNEELLKIFECHAQKTNETVASLSKQLDNFKINSQKQYKQQPRSFQNTNYRMHSQNVPPQASFHREDRSNFTQRRFPHQNISPSLRPCIYCRKLNHRSENCFYAPNVTGQFTMTHESGQPPQNFFRSSTPQMGRFNSKPPLHRNRFGRQNQQNLN